MPSTSRSRRPRSRSRRSKSRKSPASVASTSRRPRSAPKTAADDLVLNPLTGTPFSDRYFELRRETASLPLRQPAAVRELRAAFEKNDVVFISAQTGAAKTTQVPQHVLGFLGWTGRIIVTQPRSIPSASLAARVAEELDVPLGQHVGYQYRFHRMHRSQETNLLFCTEGTLVQRMRNAPLLEGIDCVILDEAHERTLEVDLLLLFLRDAALARRDTESPLKVVVMSATAERDRFVTYFSKEDLRTAVVDVPGRAHPVQVRYSSDPVPETEVVAEAVRRVERIVGAPVPNGAADLDDVLVFLSTRAEIDRAIRLLAKRVSPAVATGVGLSGDSGDVEKQTATATRASALGARRKVVFATNVAETSLTIPTIRYVIDSGRALQSGFDGVSGFPFLRRGWISQASARQRIGRAGRVQPGIAYLLYTEAEWNAMPQHGLPAIHREEMTEVLLQFMVAENDQRRREKKDRGAERNDIEEGGAEEIGGEGEEEAEEEVEVGIHDLADRVLRRMIDPPLPLALAHAQKQLLRLGALDDEGFLTVTGRRLVQLSPYGLEMARALLVAPYFGVGEEMIRLAAVRSVFPRFDDLFFVEAGKEESERWIRAQRNASHGDEIMGALAWVEQWETFEGTAEEKESWMRTQKLHVAKWATLRLVLRDLRRQLRRTGNLRPTFLSFPIRQTRDVDRRIRCLLQGFVSQVAVQRSAPKKGWQVLGTNRTIDVNLRQPYVLFLEAVEISHRLVGAFEAPVPDPRWMAEALRHDPQLRGISEDHPDGILLRAMVAELPGDPISLYYVERVPRSNVRALESSASSTSDSGPEETDAGRTASSSSRGRGRSRAVSKRARSETPPPLGRSRHYLA